ncbi:MAG: hypothetical protein JSU95_17340 [Betaproteobacteria bacterium]|nr:MAG: hypothetical protein JSU95_17340 [Betaproteobacteria bacterium]
MKRYSGKRTIDGIFVTVDGAPLNERFDIHVFDEKGFEWSYEGSAPRQLALAILVDHLGDPDVASSKVESFMQSVIANLDNDWELTSSDIDAALA